MPTSFDVYSLMRCFFDSTLVTTAWKLSLKLYKHSQHENFFLFYLYYFFITLIFSVTTRLLSDLF